jgi:signal transduction histidine kinase
MIGMGIVSIMGYEFPNHFTADTNLWYTVVQPGLLLIIFTIAYVFHFTQNQALHKLSVQNKLLKDQKNIIASQKDELTGLIDEKNYIIRILAHDVRSPLKHIQGLVKLLELETEEDRQHEIKDLMLQTSLNAENLVNRVLEMDKSEDGNTKANVARIDIAILLQEVVKNMLELAKKKHINIHLEGDKQTAILEADKMYIQLVLENLISNAIKFSEEGKDIEVRLNKVDGHIRLSVIDQGPGIAKSEEDKLFKKFSKLSTRPTAGEASTGLGLSLVKRYVELSNGKVWFERNPVQTGSIFIVDFPSAD